MLPLPFQSERLAFREFTLADGSAVQEIAMQDGFAFVLLDRNDPASGLNFATKCSNDGKDLDDAGRRRTYRLAVMLDSALIGYIGLFHIDYAAGEAELGFFVDPRAQKQGYAFESASAMLVQAREHLGLKYFRATTRTDNAASQKVLAKLGLKHVGFVPNKYKDDATERMLFRTP